MTLNHGPRRATVVLEVRRRKRGVTTQSRRQRARARTLRCQHHKRGWSATRPQQLGGFDSRLQLSRARQIIRRCDAPRAPTARKLLQEPEVPQYNRPAPRSCRRFQVGLQDGVSAARPTRTPRTRASFEIGKPSPTLSRGIVRRVLVEPVVLAGRDVLIRGGLKIGHPAPVLGSDGWPNELLCPNSISSLKDLGSLFSKRASKKTPSLCRLTPLRAELSSSGR